MKEKDTKERKAGKRWGEKWEIKKKRRWKGCKKKKSEVAGEDNKESEIGEAKRKMKKNKVLLRKKISWVKRNWIEEGEENKKTKLRKEEKNKKGIMGRHQSSGKKNV